MSTAEVPVVGVSFTAVALDRVCQLRCKQRGCARARRVLSSVKALRSSGIPGWTVSSEVTLRSTDSVV